MHKLSPWDPEAKTRSRVSTESSSTLRLVFGFFGYVTGFSGDLGILAYLCVFVTVEIDLSRKIWRRITSGIVIVVTIDYYVSKILANFILSLIFLD